MVLPLCVRVADGDTGSRDALLADGWREIETLVTYIAQLNAIKAESKHDVRYVLDRAAVVETVAELAGRVFTQDRLHVDVKVTKTDADEAKREWIRKAFANPQSHIFTAYVANVLFGFLIVRLRGTVMVIDLIGVDPAAAGSGVGSSLVAEAIAALRGWVDMVEAGTQEINTTSRLFYDGLGFTEAKRQTTFHK